MSRLLGHNPNPRVQARELLLNAASTNPFIADLALRARNPRFYPTGAQARAVLAHQRRCPEDFQPL